MFILSLPVCFQPLVLGHMGLIVRGAREPVTADLADERLDGQVDLGVLSQVRLRCETRPALRTHVRLRLVKRGVAPVARLRRPAADVEGRAQHQLLLLLLLLTAAGG